MKNSYSSENPRFACRIVRFTRALKENAGGGHVASCADCQAYYRAADQLETALRREAAGAREAVIADSSSELERSIMRAVREERGTAEPAPSRQLGWTWAFGGVAAAAIAAVFVFHPPGNASRVAAGTSDDAAVVFDVVQSFSAKLTETFIPTTGEMVANNPLQHELGSVYTDARSALNFLALNFLPNATATPAKGARPASAI